VRVVSTVLWEAKRFAGTAPERVKPGFRAAETKLTTPKTLGKAYPLFTISMLISAYVSNPGYYISLDF
jgi:hypothetical protein